MVTQKLYKNKVKNGKNKDRKKYSIYEINYKGNQEKIFLSPALLFFQ